MINMHLIDSYYIYLNVYDSVCVSEWDSRGWSSRRGTLYFMFLMPSRAKRCMRARKQQQKYNNNKRVKNKQ